MFPVCRVALQLFRGWLPPPQQEKVKESPIRVSKSGRHTDARLRKIFHNQWKILAVERKTVNITSFNLIKLILMPFFCVLWPFWHIFMQHLFWPDIFPAQWNHFQKVWAPQRLAPILYQSLCLATNATRNTTNIHNDINNKNNSSSLADLSKCDSQAK